MLHDMYNYAAQISISFHAGSQAVSVHRPAVLSPLSHRRHGMLGYWDKCTVYIAISFLTQVARRCHYTGQLYCNHCHTGDTAALPAAILHDWDFTPFPVCSMASQFLESISEQPLLCVGAISPRLYANCPALKQAHEMRQQACNQLKAARQNGPGAEEMVS